MKLVPLNKGYSAMVDDADYDLVSQHKWRIRIARNCPDGNRIYALSGKQTLLHRLLLRDCVGQIDHRDGDGLNNQRSNLRPATQSQNSANNRKRKPGASIYKGVTWDSEQRKWRARVMKDGKHISIGRFRDEVDAATAYNFAAEELFGEFAHLNSARGLALTNMVKMVQTQSKEIRHAR